MVHIVKDSKLVSSSKNLRGIIRYASKHGMDLVTVEEHRSQDEGGAIVTFWFLNRAWSMVIFASYTVACEYVAKRQRRWDCAVNYRPWGNVELDYEQDKDAFEQN